MALTVGSILVFLAATRFANIQATGWNYNSSSPEGPQHWPEHYELCGGQTQSPINIPTSTAHSFNISALTFAGYKTPIGGSFPVTNNGHSVQVSIPSGSATISEAGLGATYRLEQFHFHWGDESSSGSEHLIDNKAYPMEIHLVHYNMDKYNNVSHASSHVNDSTALAVLGIFVDVTTDTKRSSNELASLVNILTQIPHEGDKAEMTSFALEKLLPCDLSFYRYNGSLTTPGCAEVVIWTVLSQPIYMTEDQISKFRRIYSNVEGEKDEELAHNYRPVQSLNIRSVYYFKDPAGAPCPVSFAAAVRPPAAAATVAAAVFAAAIALCNF